MVIIVPSFSSGDKCDEPVVATVLFGVVISVPKHVRQAVHAPRDVPHKHGSQEHSPDCDACAQHRCFGNRGSRDHPDPERDSEVRKALCDVEEERCDWVSLKPEVEGVLKGVACVLRITRHMCEIVIPKEQPTHVSPEEGHEG